jgi:hypothetical protein
MQSNWQSNCELIYSTGPPSPMFEAKAAAYSSGVLHSKVKVLTSSEYKTWLGCMLGSWVRFLATS